MSLKTTIDIPLNGQTARCTIEVPLEAIGATFHGGYVDVTDDRIATFTAKTTAAVIKATTQSEGDSGLPAIVDISDGLGDAITIFLMNSEGEVIPCTINYYTPMSRAIRAYGVRVGKPPAMFRVYYDTDRVDGADTAEDVSISQPP